VSAPPDMPLLWVLRDLLGLPGTKFSCGVGQCRACVVHLDGEPVPACVIPVSAAAGKEITTIEGLSGSVAERVVDAWIAEEVPQCGYCQPGWVMATDALLRKTPRPTDARITEALDGHLCRCGTYPRIARAVRRAAGLDGSERPGDPTTTTTTATSGGKG